MADDAHPARAFGPSKENLHPQVPFTLDGLAQRSTSLRDDTSLTLTPGHLTLNLEP